MFGISACGGSGETETASSNSDSNLSLASSFSRDRDDREEEDERPGNGAGTPIVPAYTLVAANDLGMHCADLDYQVFSILPPFNVVHAQVIQKGTRDSDP
ncbi:hypothetical protein, partial [Kaarinaea lacus]